MKHQKTLLVLALIASIATTNIAQASLFDRGSGLLYDDALNITWLQDANYAYTSGYTNNTNGSMNWFDAYTWADNLVIHDNVRNIDYSDWRLAHNTPVNGTSFDYSVNANGKKTDIGVNITSPNSELSYMYYINLGLKGIYNQAGNYQADFGIFGNGTYNGVDQTSYSQNNVGLVHNLQSLWYWSGTEYSPVPTDAWYFGTRAGNQGSFYKYYQLSTWAVRSGDVATIPVPGAVWLFGSALLGLLGLKKRKAA